GTDIRLLTVAAGMHRRLIKLTCQPPVDASHLFARLVSVRTTDTAYAGQDSNPHAPSEQRILSPPRLPFRHPGTPAALLQNGLRARPVTIAPAVAFCSERETGLEPATPTLARLCSTN